MQKDREGHNLKHALLWLGSTTFVWQAWSWVLTILTARLLLPTDYGLLALAETALPYLGMVANLGISTWIVQRQFLDEGKQEAAFLLSIGLGVGAGVMVYLGAPYLAAFYDAPHLQTVVQLLAPTFLLQGFIAVPKSLLRRTMRFKTLGLLNLYIAIFRSLLQLTLAYLGFGYLALVAGIIFVEVADAVMALILQPVRLRLQLRADVVKEIVRFGLPVTGASVSHIIFSTADNVVVGKIFGPEGLGFYAMAFYLTDLPMSKINQVLRPVAFAHLSRLQHELPLLRQEFLKLMRGALYLTMPLLTGLLLVSREAVPLFLGQQWSPMIMSLQVLCIVGVLRALRDNLSPLLLALGHPGKEFAINLLSAVLMLPSFYFMARWIGLNGIYATWLVLFPLVTLYALKSTASVSKISATQFLEAVLPPAAATLIMAVAVVVIAHMISWESRTALFMLKTGVGIVIYIPLVFLLEIGHLPIGTLVGRRVGATELKRVVQAQEA